MSHKKAQKAQKFFSKCERVSLIFIFALFVPFSG
jgi:hypothetical protein